MRCGGAGPGLVKDPSAISVIVPISLILTLTLTPPIRPATPIKETRKIKIGGVRGAGGVFSHTLDFLLYSL